MIKLYRKKPVVVQALQFAYTDKGMKELREFCGGSLGSITKERHLSALAKAHIITLEDGNAEAKHVAAEGDYIIQGVQGEFYPCKPDIFAATYEAVDVA